MVLQKSRKHFTEKSYRKWHKRCNDQNFREDFRRKGENTKVLIRFHKILRRTSQSRNGNRILIAKMKLGVIGVSVKMLRNDYKLPDEIRADIRPQVETVSEVQDNGAKSETAKTNE